MEMLIRVMLWALYLEQVCEFSSNHWNLEVEKILTLLPFHPEVGHVLVHPSRHMDLAGSLYLTKETVILAKGQ